MKKIVLSLLVLGLVCGNRFLQDNSNSTDQTPDGDGNTGEAGAGNNDNLGGSGDNSTTPIGGGTDNNATTGN